MVHFHIVLNILIAINNVQHIHVRQVSVVVEHMIIIITCFLGTVNMYIM